MIDSSRSNSVSTIQNLYFCSKCKYEVLGEVVLGHIEDEEEFYVYIELPNKLSVNQLKCIRELDGAKSNVPISEFKTALSKQGFWKVGPFWPVSDAIAASEKLEKHSIHSVVR